MVNINVSRHEEVGEGRGGDGARSETEWTALLHFNFNITRDTVKMINERA